MESQPLLEMFLLRELIFHITDRETEIKVRGGKSEAAISAHTGTAPTTVASRWEADERSQTPSVLTRECASMKCWREAEGETEMSGYQKLWEERNPR